MANQGRGLVRRGVPLVELDRHNAKHVSPIGLILEDLSQLRLGGLPAEEDTRASHGATVSW